MRFGWPFAALLAGCWFVGPAALPARAADDLPPAKQAEFFEKSVRPILVERCLECHNAEKHRGGLRLDSRAAMMKGGDTGPVMVPHKPDESRFIAVLSHKEIVKMPPKQKLKDEEIEALVKWVKMGAPWPDTGATVRTPEPGKGFKVSAKDRQFWSFQPVANPAPPKVQNQTWAKTPLDQFILAQLEANNLRPVDAADKRTLIRRAYFDLIGLPPTPDEVEAFLNDKSPEAFAKVVDKLLASPHYGERWGRHWLDVARYGEDQAHSFQPRLYPNGFRYRDWVVKAFNDDLPYDRFIKEQIAADLLDEPDRLERLPALGFFALGPVYYGDAKKLDQYDDRIDTLTRGFLGLTVACARCHDHKFDPIATKDYYALAGIIASTEYEEVPLVSKEEVDAAIKAQTDEEKKKKVPPKYPFVHAVKEGKPTTLKVHLRGNPATLGDDAPHRFLSVLVPHDAPAFTKGSGRLELAEAIASKNNPLTARVMVNRIWLHHFGRGLVRTSSNFGALGERPTHPELLDYLASRFMASGWSIKALHREIMLSATYQLGSRYDARDAEIDGDNKFLWRMNRRRLEVEPWRDAMLAVSGKLDATLGGTPTNLADADNCRRTLYGAVSRHDLNPLLRLFDFPDPNVTCEERTVTTVPLQQLFVLNDEFMVRNAKALAARLAEAKKDDESRIREAFLLLYGRPATDRDVKLGLAFLAAKGAGKGGETLTRWEQYAQVLLSANEFLYVD
jgi:hypothetical protein